MCIRTIQSRIGNGIQNRTTTSFLSASITSGHLGTVFVTAIRKIPPTIRGEKFCYLSGTFLLLLLGDQHPVLTTPAKISPHW